MARKKTNNDLPTFDELLVPTIKALQELGGSGSIEEINSKVYVIFQCNCYKGSVIPSQIRDFK